MKYYTNNLCFIHDFKLCSDNLSVLSRVIKHCLWDYYTYNEISS